MSKKQDDRKISTKYKIFRKPDKNERFGNLLLQGKETFTIPRFCKHKQRLKTNSNLKHGESK